METGMIDGMNFGSQLDNMSLNEIKFWYEVICKSFKYTCEDMLKQRGKRLTDENLEEVMAEYLEKSTGEVELDFMDFDNISIQ